MKQYHFEESVTEGKARLHAVVEIGSLDIQTHDGRTILIDAEVHHMELSVNREDNTIYVRVEQEEGWYDLPRKLIRLLNNDNPHAHLTIRIPADCQVNAKTITGTLTVMGVEAQVTTSVIAGKTTLENLAGPIHAETVTGTVNYRGVLSNDDHRFEATTGSIYLTLDKEPNAHLDARTITGSVYCNFPLGKQVKRRHVTGAELKGILGSGEGHIKASVVTGSLRLESA